MIFYTCKYTPVELLSALGADCVLLNAEAEAFETAERETHNNLCCHAKALLEACAGRRVKELVLVNCCDSIRRVFDVLKAQNTMDFLFFMDLPHTDNTCARSMLAEELRRLTREYAAYSQASFCYEAFKKSFQTESPVPEEPFLAVLGGRVSDALYRRIRAYSTLPVADLTCGGHRRLSPPEKEADFETLMDWYAGELLGQIPCMRMQEVGQRKRLYDHPGLWGILYHTVKFCDYYAFEYEKLKQTVSLPVLKLESDFTPQAAGQLSTRIEAFMEQCAPKGKRVKQGRPGRYFAGIDSGSTTTNIAVLSGERELCAWATVRTGPRALIGAQKVLEKIEHDFHIAQNDLDVLVATGYGRNTISMADAVKTEITCHAKGAHFLNPEIRTIIDIGGQDSKVICLAPDGSVINFVMNDKCAAGTGRFLEMMARTLELELTEMSEKGRSWKEDLTISSMCTVFAESEVISLIAENKADADIIHGLNKSVASKTAALVSRAKGTPGYMMTGGVARNQGVVAALEEKLGRPVFIPEQPDLCGALGAALLAMEME